MIRHVLIFCLTMITLTTNQVYAIQPHSINHHNDNEQQPSLKQQHIKNHFLTPITHNQEDSSSIRAFLPDTVVIIDAGHGGIDGGTSYDNVLEKDINLAIAKKLHLLLQNKQIPAILNRAGDYALSEENNWHRTSSRHLKDLSQRAGLAKQVRHILFISLHVNSGRIDKATGPVVLHQSSGESAVLAAHLLEQLNLYYNTKRIPKPVSSFYLLNYVKSPAVIVELGFITNSNDRAKLIDPLQQDKLAEALAKGISHYLWIYQ